MKNTKLSHNIQSSTILLRLAMLGMAGFVLLMNGLFLPVIYRELPLELPHLANWRYLLMLALVLSSFVFFAALGQITKLLGLIDKNKAFSQASVNAMKNVKYCGFIIGSLFMACMPIIFLLADADDAPGLILIFGFIFIGVPLAVAVFAGVAQRLFQNAIDIKAENDLTV